MKQSDVFAACLKFGMKLSEETTLVTDLNAALKVLRIQQDWEWTRTKILTEIGDFAGCQGRTFVLVGDETEPITDLFSLLLQKFEEDFGNLIHWTVGFVERSVDFAL